MQLGAVDMANGAVTTLTGAPRLERYDDGGLSAEARFEGPQVQLAMDIKWRSDS